MSAIVVERAYVDQIEDFERSMSDFEPRYTSLKIVYTEAEPLR